MSTQRDGPDHFTSYVIIDGEEREVTGWVYEYGSADYYFDESDVTSKREILREPVIRLNTVLDDADNPLTIPPAEVARAIADMITQYWSRN